MKAVERLIAAAAVILLSFGIKTALEVCVGYEKGRDEYRSYRDKYVAADMECKEVEMVPGADSRKERDPYEAATEGTINTYEAGKKEKSMLPEDAPEQIRIDWKGLQGVNPDIAAWIEIPAVSVSYPVVQGKDNEYYLHRSIKGEYLYAGSIFLDHQNSPKFDNYNTILYGHNMRDGSMFAPLKELGEKERYERCPYFWILTAEQSFLYKIFSVRSAETNDSTYTIRFADHNGYMAWLQEMERGTDPDKGVKLKEGDRIVTLSTCTGNRSVRQIVQGVLVWQGEA